MAMNTVNVLEDFSTGKLNQHQKGTNGAAHVRPWPGPQGLAHNREVLDVTTRKSVTWADAENITEVTVVAHQAINTGGQPADGVLVCFDSPSNAVASAWLTETEHTASDSQRFFCPMGVPRTFRFTSNITRADVIKAADSAIAAHVIFEAN